MTEAWLALGLNATVVGVGALAAWLKFTAEVKNLRTRLNVAEADLRKLSIENVKYSTDIEYLREATQKLDSKLDQLNGKIDRLIESLK